MKDASEFWREIAATDLTSNDPTKEVRLALRTTIFGQGWRCAEFFDTRAETVSDMRNRHLIDADGLDYLSVGFIVEGGRVSENAGVTTDSAVAGQFFVFEGARPGRFRSRRDRALYLAIRREHLVAAVGDARLDAPLLATRVATSPVGPLIREHLLSMARHFARLTPIQQAFILNQAVDLVVLAIVTFGNGLAGNLPLSSLVEPARTYIAQNLRDSSLNPERVAKALGISRATLYRAFRQQGGGIAQTIRDARLEKAKELLESSPRDVSISEIALQCGILDTVNFSRQFRRRFGLSPTDHRLERFSPTRRVNEP
ncbi:MAG: AraC family transcriptional regulator [Beijerinckiaceae bacterium]|nr:AraC family transcriptional regulator [Brevundimonas sp.]MCZ8302025.1 AraC family transcriptional regulator [Beijerinckiaceae bacterium]